MTQTKGEQLAAKFRQMRELNEYGKASVQDVADELRRLSPMEAELKDANIEIKSLTNRFVTAKAMHDDEQINSTQLTKERDKLLEVNKVLVDKLRLALTYMEKYEDEFSHPTCNEMREALKLAGEIK